MSVVEMIIEILSWIAILGGSAFLIIGAIGTLRFPDFWTRLHAVSVIDSAGMILLVLGMCLQSGFTLITVKLVLIGIFLFITGPTATHAVANAALVSDLLPENLKKDLAKQQAKREAKQAKEQVAQKKPAKKTTKKTAKPATKKTATNTKTASKAKTKTTTKTAAKKPASKPKKGGK